MDKNKINANGYDYVDLELSSKTLWATCNVGASKPSDSGLYFQWGDTIGYTKDQVGNGDGKKKFYWSDYKWNPSGDGKTFTKYATEGAKLELEDDAANVNMGGDWHMPTPEQIRELLDNTISTWTEQNYVKGRLFTSKKDESKSIFIPAAGYVSNGSLRSEGSGADVWSSMLVASDVSSGRHLDFGSSGIGLGDGCRYYGFSVRGVIG